MGGTSDKLDAEMEKKDRRNTIQPTGICKAADTGDCAEGNATNTGQLSLRVAEEADPAGAPDLRFDHRCRSASDRPQERFASKETKRIE